jgi:protein-disulfide isomerase
VVQVVWKHQPLAMHQKAPLAHMASMAAHEQGKFWEFHDKIFGDQKNLDLPTYKKYAKELGLDVAQFEAAVKSEKFKAQVEADAREAEALGNTGTPAFFVNGRFLSGAKPFEAFAAVINEELRKKNLPIPAEAASAGG